MILVCGCRSMLMQTRLKSMSHYQSQEKLRPIRKHYLTAYPTGCSRTENTLRICHCFTFYNCKYLFKTGMLTLWSPVCSWCKGLWEQPGTTAAGTRNPAWQPQQRSRNVYELTLSSFLARDGFRCAALELLPSPAECQVQRNAAKHWFKSLMWCLVAQGAGKCFTVICPGWFAAPWYCCWALLRTSQHLVFWFIPFHIKILAKC